MLLLLLLLLLVLVLCLLGHQVVRRQHHAPHRQLLPCSAQWQGTVKGVSLHSGPTWREAAQHQQQPRRLQGQHAEASQHSAVTGRYLLSLSAVFGLTGMSSSWVRPWMHAMQPLTQLLLPVVVVGFVLLVSLAVLAVLCMQQQQQQQVVQATLQAEGVMCTPWLRVTLCCASV
jgi:hypothetical protein